MQTDNTTPQDENALIDQDIVDSQEGYIDASKGNRFANYIIDMICFYAFAFVVGGILGLLNMVYILESVNEYLLGYSIFFIYYVLLEGITGRTIRKLVTGTKVIDDNGNKPTLLNIMGRTLCRIIPFEAFSFLFADRGWHDSISKTRVVKIR